MAKTDHQCTRDLHTKGKPSKPRSLGEQSVAHHVTDLPTMGLDEAQALGTMDSSMGIAADVRWSPGAGSRTSLVAALALFGTLGDKTDTSDRGATDIYKCFDQIVRPVVCTMARVAGIPKRILTPYVSIMEALRIRNSLTVGYGALHTRQRGIPQGCPFSMTLTALMVRSCIIQVQKRGAIPRVLVDDLHLVAVGEKHYENYMKAIRDTHMFITTVGGRIAPSKSHAYSTDRRTRKRLHNTRYDILIRQGPGRHVLSRCWGDRSTRPTG